MKTSTRFLQVLGTASLALLVACGDSSSTEEGGAGGATAGSGGIAGIGGSAGSGGAKAGNGGTAGIAGSAGAPAGGTSGAGGSDPAGAGGSDPAGAGGSDPAGAGGSDPAGAGGSDPAGAGGSDPAGAGGSDPAGAGGSDPAGAGGSDPAGAGGSDPAGAGGSDPAGAGGSDPAGAGGSDPAGAGGSDPAGAGGSDPAGAGGSNPAGAGGSNPAGSGGSGGQAAGSGGSGFCPFPPCDGGGAGGSGGSPPACNPVAGQDKDGDGFPFPADCNDCDPATNPGALDVYNVDPVTGAPLPNDKQIDEDCSGSPTLTETTVCDKGLALNEADAVKGANAIDICQTTTADSPKWGIISAEYVQMNGAALPKTNQAALGRGIMASFGPNVEKQFGENMLVLSSGTARAPGQTGYQSPSGFSKNYTTGNPAGFPVNSPSCPGVESGTLNDSIALRVRLRAPTNAKSISFKFKFYTYEYPSYICSQFNDIFVAVMRDKDGNFIQGANQETGNISFDKDGNYLSVNAGFLEVCSPGTYGGKQFDCPLGTDDLQGTGFEGHGATGWLQTNAPVKPGEEFELLFGIADAGDGILDSTVLLDSFQWSANEGQVQTGDECKLGGAGSCTSCLSSQIPKCCDAQYTACINDKEGGSGSFNPGCNGILNCIQVCAGNAQCQQSCYDSRPNGQPEYDAYRDCLYGPAGDPDNFGACGKSCQLAGAFPQEASDALPHGETIAWVERIA
jgi:hypothetical protein